MGRGRAGSSRAMVWLAAGFGAVHAAFSLYWALGGTWLLATVGQWTVRLSEEEPFLVGVGLGFVALVKLAGAAVPVGVEYGHIGWRRMWRASCWIGGVGLIAYGGINIVVSGSVLAGLIHVEGGYDSAAMIGHALLWDPLFLLWGCALVAWLALSRDRSAP